MAAAKLSDEAFSAILEAHPGLRERFASIAMAVANSGENLKEADAIEERIVEEMRLLGREAMQGWAETQVKATEKEIRQQPSMHRQGKKNSAGSSSSICRHSHTHASQQQQQLLAADAVDGGARAEQGLVEMRNRAKAS